MGTNWLQLDESQINEPRSVNVNGVPVQLHASPFDVPEAVRGGVDPITQRFVIEFKYLTDDEPLAEFPVDADVSFFVGQKSKRLYRIAVNAQRDAQDVVRRIQQAINHLGSLDTTGVRHRLLNYETAGKAVSSVGGRLSYLAVH